VSVKKHVDYTTDEFKMVSVGRIELPLFLFPKQVPYQTRRYGDKMVVRDGVEPPESLKTIGLQPIPLPLRDNAPLKLVAGDGVDPSFHYRPIKLQNSSYKPLEWLGHHIGLSLWFQYQQNSQST